MLKIIEENYKYLLLLLLAIYLINTLFLHEMTVSITVIILVIGLEWVNHRQEIKNLSYSQLSVMGVVLLAGIASVLYLVILVQIFIEPLQLPIVIVDIIIILVFVIAVYLLYQFLKKLFQRALEH